MLIIYPGKVVHEAVIESLNPNYSYICSFLQSKECAIIKIISEEFNCLCENTTIQIFYLDTNI